MEDDLSSDSNSENNENNNDSLDYNNFKNSKSQDIRIKNFNTIMFKDIDTPPKINNKKRPRLNSMSITISKFFLEEKDIGYNRAERSLYKLQELNYYVKLTLNKDDIFNKNLSLNDLDNLGFNKYNVIILANTNENHEIGYNYIKKDNLKIIASHLKKDGKFCVYLFLKNKYLKERINNEIKDIFKNVSIFQYKSDYIFICHKGHNSAHTYRPKPFFSRGDYSDYIL